MVDRRKLTEDVPRTTHREQALSAAVSGGHDCNVPDHQDQDRAGRLALPQQHGASWMSGPDASLFDNQPVPRSEQIPEALRS